ncbi:MAG: T9SS type A sorting domain-containing protein, partial [Opitutaceae bacterium]|nr:T9SS type A sorting domain-containing protein [Cytophagales bacterium]
VDYLWWGTPDSKKYLDKIEEWANGKGISNIVAGFSTSGSNIANYKNSAFTGAFAIGAMATNQTQVNGFYNWWVNNSITEGNVGSRLDDRPYFQNTLRVMYALVASGNFWNPYSSGSGPVTPPPASVVTVSLVNPANNASFVQGSPVNIEASASSTQGATIVDVEFIVDGVTAFSDKTAPFTYSTSALSEGTHTIAVKANDSNGKTASTSNITITITKPIVNSVVSANITSPLNGSVFSQGKPVDITVAASSTNGATILSVDFMIDGILAFKDNSSPFSYSTSSLTVGNHTITVKATDSNGKTAESAPVQISVTPVVVSSDVSVQLNKPANGSNYIQGSLVELGASASSTGGATITNVSFIIDGKEVFSDVSSPFEYSVSNLSVGAHSIMVKATDSNGKSASTSPVNINITTNTIPTSTENVTIPKPSAVPMVDGIVDDVWNKVETLNISKEIIPSITGPADLSGNYKTMWDNNYIYVLVNVTDDIKINDSGNEYFRDDAVELFFDIGNDKSSTYGSNDIQYTFRWNDKTVYAGPAGRSSTNVEFQMVGTSTGYTLEVKIPWSTIQGTPAGDQLLGFDVQINDDDNGGDRDSKLAWAAPSDDAWQNPSLLGIAKLGNTVTGLEEENFLSDIKIFPNPFSNYITIEGLNQFEFNITDMSGKIVHSGTSVGTINTSFETGLYYLILKKPAGIKPIKIVKMD